jgi:hypothetical protein
MHGIHKFSAFMRDICADTHELFADFQEFVCQQLPPSRICARPRPLPLAANFSNGLHVVLELTFMTFYSRINAI